MSATTTTTRPLDLTRERNLLALGDATPRRRARLHGLDLAAYLRLVYPGYGESPRASCLRCRREMDAAVVHNHANRAHGYRRLQGAR